MPNIAHVFLQIKKIDPPHRSLFQLCLLLFFFLLADGILMYHVPLFITNAGFSEYHMGLIIGFSSIAGIIFDLLMTHLLPHANFKRMFFLMLLIATSFPFIFFSNTLLIFLLGMIIWGIYYDLYNCGTLDFVSRIMPKKDHATSFGVIDVFIALGYLLAPLIAGLFAEGEKNILLFITIWFFLGISFLFYLVLSSTTKISNDDIAHHEKTKQKHIHFFRELSSHTKIAKSFFTVYITSTFLNMIESIYWIVAPLIIITTSWSIEFGSLFLFAHELPALLVGWFIGKIIGSRSKKQVGFVSLFAASVLMILFFFTSNPILLILLSFLCAVFTGIAWPCIKGAQADFVSEHENKEQETEMVQDIFTNAGFIIGPILGGFLASKFGYLDTLGVIGVCGFLLMGAILIHETIQKHS